MTYLYIYVKAGTAFKVGDQLCEQQRIAMRADYVILPNGDAIGKVVTSNGLACRTVLGAVAGITVLPPQQRELTAAQIAQFNACGVEGASIGLVSGDTAYDFGEKLYASHSVEWMHPENWFIGGGAGKVDAVPIPPSATQNPSTPAPVTSTGPT